MGSYKFNLNTYKYPPLETCTLQELEKISEERLQLYRIMDSANCLNLEPNTKKWDEYVESKIIENKLRTYSLLLKSDDSCVGLTRARRNDHIAHWLLSLCYCRNATLRCFFMCCELYWFTMLYKRMKKEDITEFLKENEFSYDLLTLEERERFKNNLCWRKSITESTAFYKAKFTEVINLVKVRQVYLYRGYAYFPEADVIFCVKRRLWRQFNRQLVWTNRMIPTAIEEDRINDFLANIPLVTPTSRYISDDIPKITVDDLDTIADKHFPLCMKSIHQALRDAHHLKYDCKMQYGIFLKCLGLDYEDAMTFWKQEFMKNMSSDWYDRKYAYLFKHQYGKVGAMLDYKPYSCKKILNLCPMAGQHHGCPFKHWDVDWLLERCQKDRLNAEDIASVKSLIGENKFTEACTVYFCGTHKVFRDTTIESPNQYFKESYETERYVDRYFSSILESCDSESM